MPRLILFALLLCAACTPGTLTPYAIAPSNPIQRAGYAQVDAGVTASAESGALATQYWGMTATAQPHTETAIANAETATTIANAHAGTLSAIELGKAQIYATATISAFVSYQADQQQAEANRAAEAQLIHNQKMQTLETNAANADWWRAFWKLVGIVILVCLALILIAIAGWIVLERWGKSLANIIAAQGKVSVGLTEANANARMKDANVDLWREHATLASAPISPRAPIAPRQNITRDDLPDHVREMVEFFDQCIKITGPNSQHLPTQSEFGNNGEWDVKTKALVDAGHVYKQRGRGKRSILLKYATLEQLQAAIEHGVESIPSPTESELELA